MYFLCWLGLDIGVDYFSDKSLLSHQKRIKQSHLRGGIILSCLDGIKLLVRHYVTHQSHPYWKRIDLKFITLEWIDCYKFDIWNRPLIAMLIILRFFMFVGETYAVQIWWLLWHYCCWLSRLVATSFLPFALFPLPLRISTLLLIANWEDSIIVVYIVFALKNNNFPSEAHPDVIQSNGLATPESYQSDLAYLKQKVFFFLYKQLQLISLKGFPWKWDTNYSNYSIISTMTRILRNWLHSYLCMIIWERYLYLLEFLAL